MRPDGRYADSPATWLANPVSQLPTMEPSVPPAPMKAKSRLPWSKLKTSTMNAQKTLVMKRFTTLSQT